MAEPIKPIKRKVPLGKPLRLSKKELDRVSQVTETDIAKAQAAWKKAVPSNFKNLLDAESVDNANNQSTNS